MSYQPAQNLHQIYREQLDDFIKYLRDDWKRWAIMQIKQAMLEGKTSLFLCNMKKTDWRKGKTLLNFWKDNPVEPKDNKYYHEQTNVIITNKWIRKIIDFLTDVGAGWLPVASQKYETFTLNYNQLHILIKYPPLN